MSWWLVVFFGVITAGYAEATDTIITGHPFEDKDMENVHGMDKGVEEDISITLPGTKWCGPGNTSNGYDDLGIYAETDKCCRDHDYCENIPAGKEKYGLTNEDIFTRLHCDCDKQFYQCLHAVNGTISNFVGKQYFLFRNKCFKEAYPIVQCLEYQTRIFSQRCIKYQFDGSQPMVYQWFDIPYYDTTPYPYIKLEK